MTLTYLQRSSLCGTMNIILSRSDVSLLNTLWSAIHCYSMVRLMKMVYIGSCYNGKYHMDVKYHDDAPCVA